ncbi:alpha/beta fold hydrolase [Lysobacter sp. GCM10012299]|uniref:alpha/beta fold hydrolase n=1 Tax=Lysobacter sp. GCM10012299 TaxID=3317333 RepID=UPI0036083955
MGNIDRGSTDQQRRRLLSGGALGIAVAPLGLTGPASAQVTETKAVRKTAPIANSASFEQLQRVRAGVLEIAYVDIGPKKGPPVILLHGWPYDIHSYAEVAPILASAGYRVIVPNLRGYGATRFLSADTSRNGQPAALADDVIQLMDALKIPKAVIAGYDWGGRSAGIVAALWPQRVKALVGVSGYLIGSQKAAQAPLAPEAELQWWYQFYFATERGRAGYAKNRHDFAKLIWKLASPKWNFDDATFDLSAAAFENPDHVDIVIHNYRWRLGLAEGEAKYDDAEQKLALFPPIAVPTITLEGDANGAPHPLPESYAKRFTGKYQHRLLTGGIGHNPPQEAPREFAQAVIDADRL